MHRWTTGLLLTCALTCAVFSTGVGHTDDLDDAYRYIDGIKREAGEVPYQAEALVQLAWGDATDDPDVRFLARRQLVEYANDALPALRQAIRTVPERYQADVVTTVIAARGRITADLPETYLPAMEEALWYGSVEARRMAIPEVTSQKYRAALLTLMDTAYEYPELTNSVTHALGYYGDDKARHFLLDIMRTRDERESRGAARALARIGGRALGTLREAARDDNEMARSSAIAALIPISSIDDLSRLYEFIGLHPDADPDLIRQVTERAELLEVLLERHQQTESATVLD